MPLVTFTERGFYCKQADVYIDPWKPVSRALITHGHSDHARYGSRQYLCSDKALPVIRYRLGDVKLKSIPFGKEVTVNGVKISFHPAGHIIGSAQIRLEYKGEIWVASGDYKLVDDGLAEPYEPIKCHHFITESTFGLPVFKWKPQEETFAEINAWWEENQAQGKVSILSSYALGKAQRVLNNLDTNLGKIFTHGAVENTNQVLRKSGVKLSKTIKITSEYNFTDFKGHMVIATPNGINSSWVKKFKDYSVGIASGWMAMRGARRRRGADRGFVLSDHADWDELNSAVAMSEAENIYVTHGYSDIYVKWLSEQGYNAQVVKSDFFGDEENVEE